MHSGTAILLLRVRRRFHEANIVVVHRSIEVLGLVAPNVWPVSNYTKRVPTLSWFHANERTHVGPNNAACCWPKMLRPFTWAFRQHWLYSVHFLLCLGTSISRKDDRWPYRNVILAAAGETPANFGQGTNKDQTRHTKCSRIKPSESWSTSITLVGNKALLVFRPTMHQMLWNHGLWDAILFPAACDLFSSLFPIKFSFTVYTLNLLYVFLR